MLSFKLMNGPVKHQRSPSGESGVAAVNILPDLISPFRFSNRLPVKFWWPVPMTRTDLIILQLVCLEIEVPARRLRSCSELCLRVEGELDVHVWTCERVNVLLCSASRTICARLCLDTSSCVYYG